MQASVGQAIHVLCGTLPAINSASQTCSWSGDRVTLHTPANEDETAERQGSCLRGPAPSHALVLSNNRRCSKPALHLHPTSLLFTQHYATNRQDALAEWSKALAQGASPKGRGFEPHRRHMIHIRYTVSNTVSFAHPRRSLSLPAPPPPLVSPSTTLPLS